MIEITGIQVRLPFDMLKIGMRVQVGVFEERIYAIHPKTQHFKTGHMSGWKPYHVYQYTPMSLQELEGFDPIRSVAIQILRGDPMATDLASDILRR